MAEIDVSNLQAPAGASKVINLQRNAQGEVVNMKEVKLEEGKFDLTRGFDPFKKLTEARLADGSKVNIPLREAMLNQPDAAEILRTGIRFLAFSKYQNMPRTFEQIVTYADSSKPQEEYLRDAAIGRLPYAPSGTEAPEVTSSFEGGVTIVNNLYRAIVSVLGDWIKFDQIGKIKQTADLLGRALRMTEEFAVYSALTTAGNYARNSTTNDNDVGANTSALTFSGIGLEQALATVATSRDRKSGAYLGYKADTIVIGPRMEVPVKQLLLSPMLMRVGGNTSNEVRGMGMSNQYMGMVNNIIISPWFPTSVNGYQWLIFDSTVPWVQYQTVEAPSVLQEDQNAASEAWLTKDKIRFLARSYFGVGIVDDRAAYLSTSTTAPVVS